MNLRLDMSRGAFRAVMGLLVLTLIVGGGNLLATYLQVNSLRQASQKASAAGAAQVALCRAANASRAEQVGLWEYIIHLSKPPKTAQQRQVLAEFEHHLRVVFAPRNCALPRPGG